MLFRFEIQSYIDIEIEADTADEARMILVNNRSIYEDKLAQDCYISNGRVC